MKKRYQEGGEVDAMEEANSRSMLTPRKVSIGSSEEEDEKLNRRTIERSRDLQNMISSGSDIVGRPQDEGYRPNAGTARERAMAEGAYDSGKIIESGDQGFGGPGSSRTVKAPKPAIVTKEQLAKSGHDNLRDYLNAKQGLTRRKEKNPTPKLIDPKNIRIGGGMKSGGMTASSRGDGIAQRGKTRGKMC